MKKLGNQVINGLKEFRRFIVRKSDGTECIKAGDGFVDTEIDGVRVKTRIETAEADIDTLESVSHTHSNKAILDATTASYTTAEETKLAGIEANADVTDTANVDAAGATMNTDTDVSGNSWVLDEDDMASDSDEKVPTQQSVKAYAMGVEDYTMTAGRIMNPLLHLPLKNNLNMVHGTGSVSFTRSTTATYIDRYGVVKSAAVNEPRFEKEGLLIEGSSTNKCLYSEDFSNSAWSKQRCSIGGSVTLPDGSTGTVNCLIPSTDNSTHFTYNIISTSAAKCTGSVFVKLLHPTHSFLQVQLRPHLTGGGLLPNYSVVFDLKTGSIFSTDSNIEFAAIQKCNNGWYRCTLTTTTYSGAGTIDSYYFICSTGAYAGDGSTSAFGVWGAQLEEKPFATSYIPTTSAAVTRTLDYCYLNYPGNIPNTLTSRATVICDADILGYGTDNTIKAQTAVYSGGYTCVIAPYRSAYDYGYVALNSSLISIGKINPNQTYRFGVSRTLTQAKAYLNGNYTGVSANRNLGAMNTLYIGGIGSNNVYSLNGHISNVRIYDVTLTEEEMAIA